MYIKRKETNINKTLKQVINSLHNWIQNVMIKRNMQVKTKQAKTEKCSAKSSHVVLHPN